MLCPSLLVHMTVFWIIFVNTSITLALTIIAAVRRPEAKYKLIAALAVCALIADATSGHQESIHATGRHLHNGTGFFATPNIQAVFVDSFEDRKTIAVQLMNRVSLKRRSCY